MTQPQIARLIGGAGTGKTTELMRIMGEVIDRGIDPMHVGFVSFTRAARQEAAERAAKQFGLATEDLLKHGWFRTLHSVCFRALGNPDGLLTGNAESRDWLREHVSPQISSPGIDEDGFELAEERSMAGEALTLWQMSRSRLEPIAETHRRRSRSSTDLPPLSYCQTIAKRYEEAKILHGRCDFADLLLQVAGAKCHPEHGVDLDRTPQGDLPRLPVWFFDEQQDTSALLDRVCRRLASQPGVRWCYVAGDPFQAIYSSFMGADSRLFRAWPVAKERVMPQTYRCPDPIHRLGEQCLAKCSDYFDRGIASASHDGAIAQASCIDELVSRITPTDSWLLIARTHYLASAMSRALEDVGLPWTTTQGTGGWVAPARNAALLALSDLEQGLPVNAEAWWRITQLIPASESGTKLLARGTKTRFADAAERARLTAEEWLVDLLSLSEAGGTDSLVALIASGRWTSLSKHAPAFRASLAKWGEQPTTSPTIKVGTIHSVKGAEADHVGLLTSTTGRIAYGRTADRDCLDEERRVAYVGVTRARQTLTLIGDPKNKRHKLDLPGHLT